MKHFEERPVTAEIEALTGGDVVRIWRLKRDNSARFILRGDGKIYIIGNTKVTDTFTDEEWLEAMKLGVPTLKPLRTKAEIDAAYPEHKKLMEAEDKINALLRFVRELEVKDYIICYPSLVGPNSFDPDVIYRPAQMKWTDRKLLDFVWAYLGIDAAKIWAEKDDMLTQLAERGL